MQMLEKLSDALDKLAVFLGALILGGVFLLVMSGVVFRITGHNFSLSEELSRWGLVSICFIGSSAALKRKQHVGVNMLLQVLPLGIGKVCVAVSYLAVLTTVAFSAHYSLRAAMCAQGMVGDIVPVSMMYVKLSLPFGMAMMFVHLLYGLFSIPKGKTINSVLIGTQEEV
ncbi:TRAP transporter small permease [Oleispirillum naphthae]|uniref:TRAP transporter small permease n=1 Tax=Oleispirillum naphthae TaxID=2838853 RepID=UPI003082369D